MRHLTSQDKTQTAFVLSLTAGILMILGGGMSGFGGMMGGFGGMMGGVGFPFGFMGGFSLIGLISGIIVLSGAIMLNSRPTERRSWGTIILIFSIISFLGMGGFFIGAILGIIGGALALSQETN